MGRLYAAGAMSSLSSIIVLLLLTEVNAQLVPPRLTPQTETGYIVVQAGDTFELNCESKSTIGWTYPEYSNPESKASLNVTHRTEPNSDFQYKSTLEVSNAFFMDTGYYHCNTIGKDGAISDSTRIYVFVRDLKNLLLSGETVILAYEHKSNVIPCKPTSPDVEVTLSNDEYEVGKWDGTSFQSNFTQRWNFTPQQGFTMKFSSFEDEGMYNCIAKSENHENETTYILHVLCWYH